MTYFPLICRYYASVDSSFLFLYSQSLCISLCCVFETASLISAFSLFVLKLSVVFHLLLATFCPLLWTTEHPPLWKPGCSFSSTRTKMPESAYLHPQKLLQQTVTLGWSSEVLPECPVPCLRSARTVAGLFVVENLSGTREQGTVLFPDILRLGAETVQS